MWTRSTCSWMERRCCSIGRRLRFILMWSTEGVARTLDPELRRALAERVRYCHELGIYDFYRRETTSVVTEAVPASLSPEAHSELREEMSARKSAAVPVIAEDNIFEVVKPKP